MRIVVTVKPDAHRDRLWRDGDALYAQIRPLPEGNVANDHLLRFVAGTLRVAEGNIAIAKGKTGEHKVLDVQIPDADLRPILETLPVLPQTKLFDD